MLKGLFSMNIYPSVEALIGKTPLVELRNVEAEFGLKARLVAKSGRLVHDQRRRGSGRSDARFGDH